MQLVMCSRFRVQKRSQQWQMARSAKRTVKKKKKRRGGPRLETRSARGGRVASPWQHEHPRDVGVRPCIESWTRTLVGPPNDGPPFSFLLVTTDAKAHMLCPRDVSLVLLDAPAGTEPLLLGSRHRRRLSEEKGISFNCLALPRFTSYRLQRTGAK